MNIRTYLSVAAILAATMPDANASPPREFCKALRSFVESVQPDEKHGFAFHTSWGANFKDAGEPAIGAKRCIYNDYEPGKVVCAYLMENGLTEFAGINVMDAITCLSTKTKFAPLLSLNSGAFSFTYGSANRGALIDVTFAADQDIGGMVFKLEADGY